MNRNRRLPHAAHAEQFTLDLRGLDTGTEHLEIAFATAEVLE